MNSVGCRNVRSVAVPLVTWLAAKATLAIVVLMPSTVAFSASVLLDVVFTAWGWTWIFIWALAASGQSAWVSVPVAPPPCTVIGRLPVTVVPTSPPIDTGALIVGVTVMFNCVVVNG